jgi:polysaccharide biosynthesis transport protein
MYNIAPRRADAPLGLPQPHPTDRPLPTDGGDVERLYHALLKRWRVFLAVAGGFVVLVTIGTLLVPKSYTTTVRLLAGRADGAAGASDGNGTALPILNALVLQSGVQSAETLAALAGQRDIAAAVIQQMNLKVTPQQLLGRVSVQPVANTALLNLNVAWGSADQSAQIANSFANAFVDQERDFVRSEAVAALGFLSKSLPDARNDMTQTASRLAKFQAAHGYLDAATHEQSVATRVDTIDQQIDQLKVDSSESSALLNSVNGQLAGLSATVNSAQQVAQNPVSSDLQGKLADVNTQLSEAEQKYTSAHPAVIALRQQRKALMAQIAAQPSAVISQTTVAPNPVFQSLQQQASTYKARIQGDEGKIKQLQAERRAASPLMKSLPQEAVEFSTLQEEAKRSANVYNALTQKYNDALVAKTSAISDILVVQPASADAAIKRPSLRTNVAVAVILGVLLGLAVIYVLDLLERRRSTRDYAALLGLPVLARIPAIDERKQHMLPWVQSMTVEAFLHLCVALRLGQTRRVQTLAVLSSRRGEGKSTVAYQLAKGLATLQPGVLLIDGDLRQPTLHEKSGCTNESGLTEVLSGSAELEDAIQRVAPGLDLLASRPHTANPVVLLQSRLESVLSAVRDTYNTIIVDSPPLGTFSDGLVIASHADGSLFVVAADETEEEGARRAVGQLSLLGIDNVLGIVVTKDVVIGNDYGEYFQSENPSLAPSPT